MFNVKFLDFRSFGNTSSVEIRPITFLVGENSAGKTSFLAGLRFLLESLSRQGQNPFNRDPYYLGGFEQIAHYRGGRGGRAKNFSLSLEAPTTARRAIGAARVAPHTARHEFTFKKGSPQPQLDSYSFSTGDISVQLSFSNTASEMTIQSVGNPSFQIPLGNRAVPSSIVRSNPQYIGFLVDELTTRRRLDKDVTTELSTLLAKHKIETARIEATIRAFQQTRDLLGQNVFASAPVRTQPLRTYNPSEVVISSEGSHVPLELARTKRRAGDEWRNTKQALETFGKNSGLFTEIDVRQLGRSDIDPFQMLIKINGPPMNLVDVGYGVSQALPIVYQMQNASRYDTFLLQQPEVHLHPRAQAEIGTLLGQTLARQSKPTIVVETHSDYIIDRVKIEIAAGKIRAEDVTIVFFERDQHNSTAHNLYLDENGDLIDAPDGFRSFFLEEQTRLLGI